MKKKIIKNVAVILICLSMFPTTEALAGTNNVDYLNNTYADITLETLNNTEVSPRALNLEVIYRSYNGFMQYRRWDKTNNRWYDPAWITIGPIK